MQKTDCCYSTRGADVSSCLADGGWGAPVAELQGSIRCSRGVVNVFSMDAPKVWSGISVLSVQFGFLALPEIL